MSQRYTGRGKAARVVTKHMRLSKVQACDGGSFVLDVLRRSDVSWVGLLKINRDHHLI